VSREIGDNTVVTPSITTDGAFSLALKQNTNIGEITGTFKANDSINFEWASGGLYVASLMAPIEGYCFHGAKLSMKKLVDF
jgi:hypothetical protein